MLHFLNKQDIQELFSRTFGIQAGNVEELPRAGSHRRYFRMEGGSQRCIAAYSPDPLETKAFLEFTRHFRKLSLGVPELLAEDASRGIYLLQDLGNQTLKEEVDLGRTEGEFPERIIPLYKKALDQLIRFQVEGHVGLDYSVSVPRADFDAQSLMWDLNHFKYYFVKLLGIPFDEQKLENDFQHLTRLLSEADSNFFLYRDFQSRNIMIHNNDLYFIDYQGGRRGALQYDVASILFESRINLSAELREELLEHYLQELEKRTGILGEEFRKYYYGFVLIRILQAMGAYGIRGIVENKPLFLQSIPYAIRNISWLIEHDHIPGSLPELSKCLNRICELDEWNMEEEVDGLKVRINSFSYKKGLPADRTGNGGGFIFDCRALPNPGREEKYRAYTGKDSQVREYLGEKTEVRKFLKQTFSLVEQSVREYESRDFKNLMVSFGCTGGQHRSVYCAEQLRDYLQEKFKIKIVLVHRELEK